MPGVTVVKLRTISSKISEKSPTSATTITERFGLVRVATAGFSETVGGEGTSSKEEEGIGAEKPI